MEHLEIDLVRTTILTPTMIVMALTLTMSLIRIQIASIRQRPQPATISDNQ